MIADVDRGILITQNWNAGLRTLDPPHVNGMTRNGLFRIEDGQITGAAQERLVHHPARRVRAEHRGRLPVLQDGGLRLVGAERKPHAGAPGGELPFLPAFGCRVSSGGRVLGGDSS